MNMNRANLHSVSHSCAWSCFHSAVQGENKRLLGCVAFTAYSGWVETWDLLKSWREGIQRGSYCVCIRRKMAQTQHDLCPGKAQANYHFTSETMGNIQDWISKGHQWPCRLPAHVCQVVCVSSVEQLIRKYAKLCSTCRPVLTVSLWKIPVSRT